MTDRVPGNPGQYKAVIAVAEQQKLAAAEPFTITLVRDDYPLVEGTPYSKAAVLPDQLAQTLCPGVEDPTPAEALQSLADRAVDSQEYPGCRYYVDEVGEKVWHNPPMMSDDCCCTTKRFQNQPIYEGYFNLGAMPTGTPEELGYKRVALTIPAESIVDWKAVVRKRVPVDDDGTTRDTTCAMPYVEKGSMEVTGNLYFEGDDAVLVSASSMENVDRVDLWVQFIGGNV